MLNGRCRMHGGKSTGPKTAEGLARSRTARLKHGLYSEEARAARAQARKQAERLTEAMALVRAVRAWAGYRNR